ncbi:MAG: hypothetical protein H0S85_16335 [Desulfovibrionaceae bacterium]|nr:hypothetical protein [Desulfovibrionaceae bacterium]
MLFLMNPAKKAQKANPNAETFAKVKELFRNGKFPVATTESIEGRTICTVLGLVACRGYDSEEAFFGMASRAVSKGAQAIIGYQENVAFHPDGSKFFSCYGTAVQFAQSPREIAAQAALEAKKGVSAGRVNRTA